MSKSRWRRFGWKILRVGAGVYFGAIILVFVGQRRLLYQPSKIPFEAGIKFAATKGFEPWRNQAGDYIGWKKVSSTNTSRAQILVVHGNAGSAIDRLNYADGLQSFLPADVFILEYPGYGARTGSPSQQHFFAAADEALAGMKTSPPVYLLGESLGTGVAAYLAGTHPDTIAGVLLLAPYHHLGEVAASHLPFLPVSLLLLDRYPAAKYLANYHGPVAVIVAGNDTIVPNQFGRELFDAYQGPKKLWEDANAEHNELPNQSPAFWRELAIFWNDRPKPPRSAATE